MVKMRRVAFVVLFLLLMFEAVALAHSDPDGDRLSVVLFPTENRTDIQVWESKYYPYNVLEQRMTEYLAELFSESSKVDVEILDENGMNRWLDSPRRAEDMAVQMELYGAVLKERELLGKIETGSVKLRVKIYAASGQEPFSTRVSDGEDRRYTFDPGADGLFWFDALVTSIPFTEAGMDLLGFIGTPYKGQRMSRPTWRQFSGTSHWQAIKNGVDDAYEEAMAHVSGIRKSNDPAGYEAGNTFSPSIVTGRIISPTSDSRRRHRKYIISLGREDMIRVGDVLEVVRSDTYVTVDPENPVAVIPQSIGKVRVLDVQERTSIVLVIQDNRREPIQLTDLVIKRDS